MVAESDRVPDAWAGEPWSTEEALLLTDCMFCGDWRREPAMSELMLSSP